MINYNLLPYAPDRENMKDTEFTDYRKIKSAHPDNRMPELEELKDLFNESDYLIISEEISSETKSTLIIIEDCYDPEYVKVDIRAYYNKEILSFHQTDFKPALELAQIICKKFGSFIFGYNGFNEVYLMDGESDLNEILNAPPTDKNTLEYLERRKKEEIKEQMLPDLDPRLIEVRKNNIYIKAEKLICDTIEDSFKEKGYIRHGDWFYKHEGNSIKVIWSICINFTSLKTYFMSATFSFMDKTIYEKEGIQVPMFPDINSFHKVVRYPEREDFKEWGYKNISFDRITDMNWLENEKEFIRSKAEILPKLADYYF